MTPLAPTAPLVTQQPAPPAPDNKGPGKKGENGNGNGKGNGKGNGASKGRGGD
ncbi:hypothetical protein [Mycobacterium sp. NAZ190054]|uniref:hypothetical protein n=1 Tax=Mycobacterium sp. NAZ190054 TaxID=1747766 RepID=UPI000AABB3A8|nr:hypothetical protein [Mycobacterium sp. NAZ190054]